MFAIFESGGKQHRVTEGSVVQLERLDGAQGDEIVFDKVMMVANGDDITVGQPYLSGGTVKGEVVEHGKGDKVRIIKFKRRKNYMRTKGHRQLFTSVRITAISA